MEQGISSAGRRLAMRVLALARRGSHERELAREVEAHLGLLAERFERQGMAPADARAAALRAFGGVEQVPALRAARVDTATLLNEAGRSGGQAPGVRFGHVLVAGQVALALVLLGGAAGTLKGLVAAMRPETTFRSEAIVAARFELPVRRYADEPSRVRFQDRVRQQALAIPGVETIAVTSSLPGMLPGSGGRRPFETHAAPVLDPRERPTAVVQSVTGGYFSALGLPLGRGRDFDPRDRIDALPVAMSAVSPCVNSWRASRLGRVSGS